MRNELASFLKSAHCNHYFILLHPLIYVNPLCYNGAFPGGKRPHHFIQRAVKALLNPAENEISLFEMPGWSTFPRFMPGVSFVPKQFAYI